MGQTLENGVYLPSEGERNCYAGLKTNWEILDQKVADVTALQQAVAGALHREIVESLPTTDIDPNTIYMILSGTSATENVYNEYMYVNNAWELIGTSATDLTNYYTKGEIDGKLLLKANASDLTSHTGDTTIHVTASDKNKWNNQTYVFRYSSTALVASSTNSNTLLDNTDNLKVGDKVIDSDGVLFSVTAIDTQNSTFTIGTALIDLAQDSDVVHKSGNETIDGNKTFSKYITSDGSSTGDEYSGNTRTNLWLMGNRDTEDVSGVLFDTFRQNTAQGTGLHILGFGMKENSVRYEGCRFSWLWDNNLSGYTFDFKPTTQGANQALKHNLGTSTDKWSEVHGVTYYYGSSDTEFSQKFVTTDTDQIVTSLKTFIGLRTEFKRSNNDGVLLFSNGAFSKGDTPSDITQISRKYYGDATSVASSIGYSSFSIQNNGNKTVYQLYSIANTAGSSSRTVFTLNYDKSLSGTDAQYATFGGNVLPDVTGTYNLGNSTSKWATINGLNPSSLGMPDLDNGIDISSYITVNGGNKESFYTPTVNGWVSVALTRTGGSAMAVMLKQGNFASSGHNITQENGTTTCNAMLPVKGGVQVSINSALADGIYFAYFYPCQGNV